MKYYLNESEIIQIRRNNPNKHWIKNSTSYLKLIYFYQYFFSFLHKSAENNWKCFGSFQSIIYKYFLKWHPLFLSTYLASSLSSWVNSLPSTNLWSSCGSQCSILLSTFSPSYGVCLLSDRQNSYHTLLNTVITSSNRQTTSARPEFPKCFGK